MNEKMIGFYASNGLGPYSRIAKMKGILVNNGDCMCKISAVFEKTPESLEPYVVIAPHTVIEECPGQIKGVVDANRKRENPSDIYIALMTFYNDTVKRIMETIGEDDHTIYLVESSKVSTFEGRDDVKGMVSTLKELILELEAEQKSKPDS